MDDFMPWADTIPPCQSLPSRPVAPLTGVDPVALGRPCRTCLKSSAIRNSQLKGLINIGYKTS